MSEFLAQNMKWLMFIIALVLELFYILMFTLTIRLPSFRFWPPPSARSWQFFVVWLIASLVGVCFLFLGFLDYDSFVFHQRARFPIALGLLAGSLSIGTWAVLTFDLRTTIGLGDHLITTGPYRYSRNPQYIADCASILAYMLFMNSSMVWLVGFLGIILNLLAPFTEEPWLEERFGAAYREYKRQVPRFMSLKRGGNGH
jgi:protein-S-isoprenylcysteine O-methyltransferase Ste14